MAEHETPEGATLTDDEIVTTGGARLSAVADDSTDTDTGGDTGDDSGDTSDTSDTGDDSGDESAA